MVLLRYCLWALLQDHVWKNYKISVRRTHEAVVAVEDMSIKT